MKSTQILKSLAMGIDPFTGEILEETPILQNAEVIRALFLAVETLETSSDLPTNAGNPWTDSEENSLIELWKTAVPFPKIAHQHGRTRGAIRSRLKKLGMIKDGD